MNVCATNKAECHEGYGYESPEDVPCGRGGPAEFNPWRLNSYWRREAWKMEIHGLVLRAADYERFGWCHNEEGEIAGYYRT